MIVTLTPNPSLDRTLEVDHLERGAVLRARSATVEPGGKGINVARALIANGHRARAVVPHGGSEGDLLLTLLALRGLDVTSVAIAQPVRTNVTLVEPDGTVTKVNAAGPVLTPDEAAAIVKSTVASLDGTSWLAACGSLPPGAPTDLYATVVTEGRAAGAKVAIDTSGRPLAAAVDASPDLVKPNAAELAEVHGAALETIGDVVAAAQALRERGVGAVVVSLGASGAVLVDAGGAWHAETPPVTPVSDVGAGDALLAGFLAAGASGPNALASGAAWGTAAVQLPGSAMPRPDDIDLDVVRVDRPDPTRPIHTHGGSR